MIFGIKTLRERKEAKLKESLRGKLQQMIWDLDWINHNPPLEKIVDFFNYMEKSLGEITEKEFSVAPERLGVVKRNVGRNKHGWFRAEVGTPATNEDTFIQPTGHFDENFYTHSVRQLLEMTDSPSGQGGFLKEGFAMTNKQFYNEAFVKPFMEDKLKALILIVDKELVN